MSGSKRRARDRQRIRKEVYAAVAGLEASYVLEEIAGRLKIKDGSFEVRFRDGCMQDLTCTRHLVLDPPAEAPVASGNTPSTSAHAVKGASGSRRSPI